VHKHLIMQLNRWNWLLTCAGNEILDAKVFFVTLYVFP